MKTRAFAKDYAWWLYPTAGRRGRGRFGIYLGTTSLFAALDIAAGRVIAKRRAGMRYRLGILPLP